MREEKYLGPPTESEMRQLILHLLRQGEASARQRTVDRCSRYRDEITTSMCPTCNWLALLHKTATRKAAGEFVYKHFGLFYIDLYRHLWRVIPNNRRQQQTGRGDFKAIHMLQAQLELSVSVFSPDSSEDACVRLYRSIVWSDGQPNDNVSYVVKYPKHDAADRRHIQEAIKLALCEMINGLRVPYLCMLVYDEAAPQFHKGIAIQHIHGISLERFHLYKAAEHAVANRVMILHELSRNLFILHHHRIYHQDLHAGNIVIGNHHLPYIIDFGDARQDEASAPIDGWRSETGDPADSDMANYLEHIGYLFSDWLVPTHRSRLPVCVLTAATKLEQECGWCSMKAVFDVFHMCTCEHHGYRSQPYFKPPLIDQQDKLDMRRAPAFAAHALQCDICWREEEELVEDEDGDVSEST